MDLAREIERDVAAALAEDVGSGDVTAALTPAASEARARVVARQEAVLCGQAWCEACFRTLDPGVKVRWQAKEGSQVSPGQTVCELAGHARTLLTGERTALNFLQMLSAVATATRRYVAAVAGTRAKIVDTRKTLPGLRAAEKYAVRVGGGINHRMGLYDAIMLKENHIAAFGGVRPAIAAAQKAAGPGIWIQVEVETLDQLRGQHEPRADARSRQHQCRPRGARGLRRYYARNGTRHCRDRRGPHFDRFADQGHRRRGLLDAIRALNRRGADRNRNRTV